MSDRGPLFDLSGVPEEWRGAVVYVVVSLVLGLLGVAIGGNVEAGAPPPTTAATTTTSTALSTSTSSPPTGATTTTVAVGTTIEASQPGVIQASVDTLDFAGDGTSGAFDLTNTGTGPADWTLTASTDALVVSVGSGTLGPGESVDVEVTLDRALLVEEGEIAETLTVSWAGGEARIDAVGSHDANPIIHNPRANPTEVRVDEGCGSAHTTVSARVRDTSELESVVVRWSPDGSAGTETEMGPIGNDMYEAVVGPFARAHTAELRVVAVDVRGNAGGAGLTVNVVPCP